MPIILKLYVGRCTLLFHVGMGGLLSNEVICRAIRIRGLFVAFNGLSSCHLYVHFIRDMCVEVLTLGH